MGLLSRHRASLIVRRKKTEVVPSVVVQECSIWMCSFALDITEKRSSHLPRRRNPDYGRVHDRLSLEQGESPLQIGDNLVSDLPG